jgi:predicted HTH transcriptional regulator
MINKKAPYHHSTEQRKQKKQSENTKFNSQKEIFCAFLSKNTATATMAANALRITQKNITRYKSNLEKEGRLMVLFTAKCKKTNRQADYLTTDSYLISKLKKKSNERS